MKIQIILLSCLCSSLAITVRYETTAGHSKNTKENQDALKDIRLVAVNQDGSLQKPAVVSRKEENELKPLQGARGEVKVNRTVPRPKFRAEKRNPIMERVGTVKQNAPIDQNHQIYMQKVAQQLFMAQKHASLLSDYQKFILNQDQNVKNIVLGPSVQERNPKSFSRAKQGRSATPRYEPATAANGGTLQKIVVVTPKVTTLPRKKPQLPSDHSPQAAHVKYVTLAPQSPTHFVDLQEHPSKLASFLPYHHPHPYTYYDLAVTGKPQLETVQIPSSLSVNFGSSEPPHHYKDDGDHEDSPHHEDTKYEFMYKVKDHEKNNDFGHKESRSDKTTYGYYYVHLPDGRLETVKYWADKTGYHAKVDYQGEAKHPLYSEHKLPSHNFVHP